MPIFDLTWWARPRSATFAEVMLPQHFRQLLFRFAPRIPHIIQVFCVATRLPQLGFFFSIIFCQHTNCCTMTNC